MTTDDIDLYAVLGLLPTATPAQVRRAYRELVRQNHPDTRSAGDAADGPMSDTTLQRVLAAYAVLGDPVRRADYDSRVGQRRRATRIRVRQEPPAQQDASREQPIRAGPVRWHLGPW